MAYDHPHTGETFLLIFHQYLEIPHLDPHLLCPMQCPMNDVLIDECLKYLTRNPNDHSHAIFVRNIENPPEEVIFPLRMEGVTFVLDILKPTQVEFYLIVL